MLSHKKKRRHTMTLGIIGSFIAGYCVGKTIAEITVWAYEDGKQPLTAIVGTIAMFLSAITIVWLKL
jgi:hypothetical protein